MSFPKDRPRRLRLTPGIRRMVRETSLSVDDLIYPMFVVEGNGAKETVESMPGVFRFSADVLVKEAREVADLGIPAVLLFGIPDEKDPEGSSAYKRSGVVQVAVKTLKDALPDLVVITDVCLCEYTDHGHCGLIKNRGEVDNDATLELLARTALSHVRAGADMVAPSDMMDGRVGRIREALDESGYINVPIMSYAAKYCSNFYGPFREAAESAPQFGDRKSYQMDPPNVREAVREVVMDIGEGADIVMVKPALAYLDVISLVRDLVDCPVAAYNVSGEYSMVKAAAEKGWINESAVMMELLTSIKRAGADLILTYFAPDAARLIRKGEGF